jgi:hypothetical protein
VPSSNAAAPKLPAPPEAPTRPALLRRVTPKTMTASSSLKSNGHWLPQLAVDRKHVTAWQPAPGTGTPYVEATFDKPIKLWGVRSDAGWVSWGQLEKSCRAKSVRLRLDEDERYELDLDKDARAADFLGLDATVTRVRLTYPEIWPGQDDAPLAISEISFWTDAGEAPSVPTKTVEEELAAVGGDVAKAKALLLRFGVVPAFEAEDATVTMRPVTDAVRVLEATMTRKTGTWAAYVFVGEIERDGMKRLVGLDSEIVDMPGATSPKLELARVHDVNDEHDAVITWDVVRDGKPTQHGLRVVTLARGGVEKIADFLDERPARIDTEAPKDGAFEIVLDEAGGKPRWRNRFDDRAFWYW